MRVLIINTSEKVGGAAVASHRLMAALNNHGVKAKILVRDKQTDNISVVKLPYPLRSKWNFLWERLCIFIRLHFSKKGLFDIDIANTGCDITTLKEFKEADIIHLEWINQGMLSLKNIQKILKSGKPVVWTMHDLWPATAICHYARGCISFKTHCHQCKLLPNYGLKEDFSERIWKKKERVYQTAKLHFVCCSEWLGGQAKQSGLLKNHEITCIPNPIDTHIFRKLPKDEVKKQLGLPLNKQVLLFVSQKITNERKGVHFLINAIKTLVAQQPQLKERLVVALLGGSADAVANELPLDVYPLGYVSQENMLVNIYNCADVFVIPSLEDNLPNTIMEAMACGVPCVGFRVGGIPEMINHQLNGYVANFKDVNDLAKGIKWVIEHPHKEELSAQALAKVAQNYSQQAVASRYIEVYNHALTRKSYRLFH